VIKSILSLLRVYELSQKAVLDALKSLGGQATITEITLIVKKMQPELDKTKVRDRLIILARRGLVKQQGDLWVLESPHQS